MFHTAAHISADTRGLREGQRLNILRIEEREMESSSRGGYLAELIGRSMVESLDLTFRPQVPALRLKISKLSSEHSFS